MPYNCHPKYFRRQAIRHATYFISVSHESGTLTQNASSLLSCSLDTHVDALRLALKTKNIDVVEILLKKVTSHDLFKDESGILQVAIYADAAGWRHEASHLKARIETLITHGASVNSFDDEGKSPLYCCCVKGFPSTFKLLIESGADCSLFNPFPSGEIDNHLSPYTESLGKSNLLQIALNAQQASERTCEMGTDCDVLPQCWSVLPT